MRSNASSLASAAKRVLIICSHEPELDPRIDWSARYAPCDIERIVVGFHDARRAKQDEEEVPGAYRIVRLPRDPTNIVRSSRNLAESIFLHAPWGLRIACALLLLAGGIPTVFVYECLNFAFNVFTVDTVSVKNPGTVWAHLFRRSFVAAGVCSILKISLPDRVRSQDRVAHRIRSGKRALVRRWLKTIGMERPAIFALMVFHFVLTNSSLLTSCRLLGPFQVVHANDLDTLVAAVLLKWETGCRVIYDSHEYWAYSDVNASRFEEILWTLLERVLVRHVDAAFTVSGPLAEVLTAESGREFQELPNAEPTTESYDRLAVHETTGGPVRFLFLGTFSPKRGLEELVEGWAQIGDERAKLALRGPESADRDRIIALATRLGVNGRTVHFLEPVLESELVASAAEFDVGIIPYKSESLGLRYCCPNKLSQYMQAGVAVLTNDLVYVKEVVRKYDCGLTYDSARLATLREAVLTIVNAPDLLTRLRHNAKAAARAEFNWQRKSAPLYEAYR